MCMSRKTLADIEARVQEAGFSAAHYENTIYCLIHDQGDWVSWAGKQYMC